MSDNNIEDIKKGLVGLGVLLTGYVLTLDIDYRGHIIDAYYTSVKEQVEFIKENFYDRTELELYKPTDEEVLEFHQRLLSNTKRKLVYIL